MIPWTLGFFTTPPSSSTNVRRIDKLPHGRFKLQNFLTESFLEPQCSFFFFFFFFLLPPLPLWFLKSKASAGFGSEDVKTKSSNMAHGLPSLHKHTQVASCSCRRPAVLRCIPRLTAWGGRFGGSGPRSPHGSLPLLTASVADGQKNETRANISFLMLMANLGNTLKTSLVLEHNRLM